MSNVYRAKDGIPINSVLCCIFAALHSKTGEYRACKLTACHFLFSCLYTGFHRAFAVSSWLCRDQARDAALSVRVKSSGICHCGLQFNLQGSEGDRQSLNKSLQHSHGSVYFIMETRHDSVLLGGVKRVVSHPWLEIESIVYPAWLAT